jgi:hypothetical protein
MTTRPTVLATLLPMRRCPDSPHPGGGRAILKLD